MKSRKYLVKKQQLVRYVLVDHVTGQLFVEYVKSSKAGE